MKIVIYNPQSDFSKDQQKQLGSLGEVVYTKTREELSLDKLLKMAVGGQS